MDDTSKSTLFSDVKFVIAECQDADSTKNLLIDNGAKHINYLSEHVTLVISDFTCLQADEAMNIFEKPIVSSLWVHQSLKAKRLLPPEAFCPYKNIFQDVIASFSPELTQRDRNVLACTLTYYGARVSTNTATCTHYIVAKSEAGGLLSGNLSVKTVAPDWVFESVRQNSRCNEELFEPSLLLLPPPPPPPTPPSTSSQEEEPTKCSLPSDTVSDNNSDHIIQSRSEYAGNSQQSPQSLTGGWQPPVPGSKQAQSQHNPSQMQHPPPHQQQLVSPGVIRTEAQSQPSPLHPPQIVSPSRPVPVYQRPFNPQMQSQSQISNRMQSHPQMRLQSSHTQQQAPHHMQHPHHQQHRQQIPHQLHSHPQHQQQQLGQPNQTIMQVRPQSQPGVPHRMVRPQSVPSNHLAEQKHNNVLPIHQSQMTMRRQTPDQVPFDNFNQSNQRRPEYAGTPPQYQSLPRVRQPYSTIPQQAQVQQIQGQIHHAPMPPQHQHLGPERIHTELQSHPNAQQTPHVLPQTRPLSNMQHQHQPHPHTQPHPHNQPQPHPNAQPHPHPHVQSQSQTQMQSPSQHQLSHQTHQHRHSHPGQAVMQMGPQSQFGVSQQIIRNQTHGPNHHVDQKQNSAPMMHSPHMSNMRHTQPELVSYDGHNQSKFAGDSPQYQQHIRHPQPYQLSSQQPQVQRIQSPIHHPPLPQQHQHVSPERVQPETPIHRSMQQQQQLQQLSQPHQLPHGPRTQATVQPRPQLQPTTSSQIVRPQALGLSNQIEQRQINVRPMLSPQVITTVQKSSPKLISAEESVQPQRHPSIFDHSNESRLAQIKSRIPMVKETPMQYFGHDPRQSLPKNQPLFGCKFKVVEYNDIESELKEVWHRAVLDAGGAYCDDLTEATHLVCETRKSNECSHAFRLGVRCVTIYWINDIISLNRLAHPWKALHLPHAYGVNERPLSNQIISLTNFRGRDRREVQEMILKTGAKYTDYFTSKNSLIICGSVGGDKYDRAVEWNIPLANCQFLSDVLLFGCENIGQLLTQSKYQNFARKDPLRLGSHPRVREYLQPWTEPIPLTEPSVSLEPPMINGNSDDLKPMESGGPVKVDSYAAGAVSDIKINGTETNITIKTENNHLEDHNHAIATEIYKADAYVNESSGIAVVKANDVTSEPVQLHSTQDPDQQKSDQSENATSKSKQFRKSQEPIRLLYTNVGSNMIESIKQAAAKLGLSLASNVKDCTHLLVGQLCRTTKFICAFSHASYIVTPSWLLESSATGGILDEKPFIVQDREGEEKYSFNLVHSLVKRKRRSELLFSNWIFFITPSVKKDVADIEKIIESAGGCVCTKKPPTKKQLERFKSEGKRLVVVTCDEDYYLCASLESYGADVVSSEFVISGILRQDIDIDVHRVRKKPRLEYS